MLLVCKQMIFKPFPWLVKCFEQIFKSIQMDGTEIANSYRVEDPWSRLRLVWVALFSLQESVS